MNILFSAFQLIIGGNKPALEIFTELHEEQYKTKDNTYQITIEKLTIDFYGYTHNMAVLYHIVMML